MLLRFRLYVDLVRYLMLVRTYKRRQRDIGHINTPCSGAYRHTLSGLGSHIDFVNLILCLLPFLTNKVDLLSLTSLTNVMGTMISRAIAVSAFKFAFIVA